MISACRSRLLCCSALGAFLDAAFQLLAGLAAVERGQDVLGHEDQQRALFVAVDAGTVVALHDDRAADAVVAAHRHAQPVLAVGTVAGVAHDAEALAEFVGRTAAAARHGAAAPA